MYVKINIKIHFGRLKNCQISSTNIKICVFEVQELSFANSKLFLLKQQNCLHVRDMCLSDD